MLTGPEKTKYLIKTARAFNTPTLVETGTADHQNIVALADHFRRLYTIELDHGFYEQAIWAAMDIQNIVCVYGDSGKVLEGIAHRLQGSVLWWLDAHYCGGTRSDDGDTPVATELQHIFRHRPNAPNVILIDDARLFGTDPAYPSVEWVTAMVEQQPMAHLYRDVFVKHDIIHIIPKG